MATPSPVKLKLGPLEQHNWQWGNRTKSVRYTSQSVTVLPPAPGLDERRASCRVSVLEINVERDGIELAFRHSQLDQNLLPSWVCLDWFKKWQCIHPPQMFVTSLRAR